MVPVSFYDIHPVMTSKRLAYLQAVSRDEPYAPRHGVVANHCLKFGWVESVIRLPDGSLHNWQELPALTSGEWVGQRLTRAGRKAMRDAEATKE